MVIYYSDNKSKKILENERLIVKSYGQISRGIINRLSELRVANCLLDIPNVPPPRRHRLTGFNKAEWGIDVSKNYRMVITPEGEYDDTDLSTIIEVRILRIEDYH